MSSQGLEEEMIQFQIATDLLIQQISDEKLARSLHEQLNSSYEATDIAVAQNEQFKIGVHDDSNVNLKINEKLAHLPEKQLRRDLLVSQFNHNISTDEELARSLDHQFNSVRETSNIKTAQDKHSRTDMFNNNIVDLKRDEELAFSLQNDEKLDRTELSSNQIIVRRPSLLCDEGEIDSTQESLELDQHFKKFIVSRRQSQPQLDEYLERSETDKEQDRRNMFCNPPRRQINIGRHSTSNINQSLSQDEHFKKYILSRSRSEVGSNDAQPQLDAHLERSETEKEQDRRNKFCHSPRRPTVIRRHTTSNLPQNPNQAATLARLINQQYKKRNSCSK